MAKAIYELSLTVKKEELTDPQKEDFIAALKIKVKKIKVKKKLFYVMGQSKKEIDDPAVEKAIRKAGIKKLLKGYELKAL